MILLKVAFGMFLLSCACWLVAKMTAPNMPEPFEYPSELHVATTLAFVALLFIAFVVGAVGMVFL